MLSRMRPAIVPYCIALIASMVTPATSAVEKPVFALDFEGTATARGREGEKISPLVSKSVEFVAGLKGQALNAQWALLEYPASVLPRERGTLAMWICPLPEPPGEELSKWRGYFADADAWRPLPMPRLWLFGSILRFDMGPGKWLWSSIPLGSGWGSGAWHQLIGTWDCSGHMALYFDGQKLMEKQFKPWEPKARRAFRIGSAVPVNSRAAHALIDEVRLYDEALDAQQVHTLYLSANISALSLYLPQTVFKSPPATLPVVVRNTGGSRWHQTLHWHCGQQDGELQMDLAPGQRKEIALQGAMGFGAQGLVNTEFSWQEGSGYSWARTEELTAYIPQPLSPPPRQVPEWKEVATVDCAAQPPISEVGESRVVAGPAGRYREAGPNRWDRFGYVFELSGAQKMVRLTVEHPDDDKRATVLASSIPAYDESVPAGSTRQILGNGFLSGGALRVTNKMVKRQYVFPAISEHLAIIVETGVSGQRAAVGTMTLEEADTEYSPAAPSSALQASHHRRMGLFWEDPVFGLDFGWAGTDYIGWDRILTRALNYMAWAGEDLLLYPTVWYQGPVYRSVVEPGTWPYGSSRNHPPDYPRLMAIRCAQRDIEFIPTFIIWQLPSLNDLIRTEAEVIAGKPSVNAVTSDGQVMTSVKWHSPPLLNAQHPAVREALLALIVEHIELCGDISSFGGIEFGLWPPSPMQAGARLLTSYDDWTVNEFARHIGESPPGDSRSADRFRQRADWILNNPQRRSQWVQWRCEMMTDFYQEVARRLAQANPQAKLHLLIQQPYPWYDTDPAQALLEQGINLEVLSANPHIVIDRYNKHTQTYHRIARLTHPAFVPEGGTKLGVITDYDAREMTRQFQRPFWGLPQAGSVIQQQYYETHPALSSDDSPKLQFPKPWRVEAHGRCSQPAPTGRYFLRDPALSVYLFNAKWISIGGYNLGTLGAENLVREFATAFQALPAVPFADLGCTGPIVVRTAHAEGYKWIYAVNITDNEARLSLRVADRALANVVTGDELPAPDGHATFELRPYELLAWRTSSETEIELRGPQQAPADTGLGGTR